MSYRIRLGKMPRKFWKYNYKSKTVEEILKDRTEDFEFYQPMYYTQLYELGKWISFKEGREEFYSFDIKKEMGYEFDILSKEGLKVIIDYYHEEIKKYLQEMVEEKRKGINNSSQAYLERRLREWDNKYGVKPYYLEESSDGFISGSYLMEYAIFNLTYIYKTFDFKKDLLIYSGW